MSRDLVLAVDLGTSGPKVGLATTSGALREAEFEPVALHLSPGGGAEQDPEEWWRSITTATRRLLDRLPAVVESIAAVSCTTQWSGTVPVDAQGDPLGNAIIWMDTRGAAQVANLIGGPVRVQGYDPRKLRTWIRLTGGAPTRSGKDSIAHILWLREARPDVYRRAALFLEPKDYLNLRLTGRAAAGFDSIVLHWVTDNRRPDAVRYDEELLRLAGIPRDRLPPLVAATSVVGRLTAEAAADLGVPAGLPVVGGSPDVQTAAVGSGAIADFAAHLYVGTSSWISAHVPFKKTDLMHGIASLPAPLPGRWFVANEQETAGACLDFLAESLFPDVAASPEERYRRFDEIAATAPAGANGVIFTPWLYGERTPVEDASVRAGFFNISLGTTRDHMVRAVFEGVALNARWLLRHVDRFCGRRLAPITFVGGGARSDVWAQIFADVLDRPIRQVAEPSWVNLRGAALLAGLALGHIRQDDIPSTVPIRATYEPDRRLRDTYDRAFREFVNLYKATRRVYRRLNPPTGR